MAFACGNEFWGMFVMIKVVRPGQVVKWPSLTDMRSVDGIGLKIVLWREAASSDFFGVELMMLQARLGVVVAVLERGNWFCWDKGM